MHLNARATGLAVVCGVAVTAAAMGRVTAQSGSAGAASKEWPTYGHDSGGMRFSPLTEITPATVEKLKVAWVYHMRPAGVVAPEGRGTAAGAPAGDTPEGAPPGRGRGRGGSGFSPSENTPLVIDGT